MKSLYQFWTWLIADEDRVWGVVSALAVISCLILVWITLAAGLWDILDRFLS